MTTNAGTLTIDIAAGVARLESDMEKVRSSVEKGMNGIEKATGFAKEALGALGIALTLAAAAEYLKRAADIVDVTAKMSDRFGIATEKLMGMQLAARSVGIEDLNGVLARLSKTTTDAVMGVEAASDAYQRLGLNADKLSRLPLDQQFEIVGQRLLQVGNIAERNALTMEIFSKRANEVLSVFMEGSEGIRKWTEDAKEMNAVLSRVDSAQIEIMNNALTRAKLAGQGLANTILLAVAPIVTELSSQFADAAKETHGFREEILDWTEAGVKAFAYLGNIVTGLKFAWMGLKVAAQAALDAINQGIAFVDRTWTDFYNKVADSYVGKKLGLEAKEYSEATQRYAEESSKHLEELQQQLEDIAMKGLPSDHVTEWFANLRKQIHKSAEEIAHHRQKLNESIGGVGPNPQTLRHLQKEELDYRNHLDRMTEQVKRHLMTQRQLENDDYNKRMATLFAAHSQGLLTEEQFFQQREILELQHQAALGDVSAQGELKRREFMEMNARQQTQTVLQEMLSLTQGVAAHNRAMFEINKVAGIANAIVNTFVGVTNALKAYPPPISFAMAALQLAAGMAQVQQIKAAQFGSSTSAPSISGGGATPVISAQNPAPAPDLAAVAPAAQATPQRVVNVYLKGDGAPSDSYVRDLLIPALNDAIDDGTVLNVMPA